MKTVINAPADDRILASYNTGEDARMASTVLKRKLGIENNAIEMITPSANDMGRKLEGEDKAVGRNMLSQHVLYACLGLAIGLSIAHILVLIGPNVTQTNPVFTYIALTSPGIFIGMFFADFRSLKPEHDALNQTAVKAAEQNLYTLVVKTSATHVSPKDIEEEIRNTPCVKVA